MQLFGRLNKIILFVILALAFALRVWGISTHPTGFTPDEASFGYDAYSLLKTGKDQWGSPWPLMLRSFGDFKLPLYAYLAMPSISIFGLNEFATRLPASLIGILAVFATYLLTKGMFGDERLGIIASALLAISPWHVPLSRGAFEANLTVLFMTLGVWMFYKGITNKKWLIGSAIAFGLNLFSYHSARLVTPIIIAALVFGYRRELNINNIGSIKKYLSPILLFLVFLTIAFYGVFMGGGSRAADITIFNPTDKWMSVFDRRYEAVFAGLPIPLARIFSNKLVYLIDAFTNTYSTYLSPQFLFTLGPGEWTYGMVPGRGMLYLIELPFVLASLWFSAKFGLKKNKTLSLVLFWILISIVPAALTKGPGYAANRAAVMMPAIQIFSAYGAMVIVKFLSSKVRGIFIGVYIMLFLVSLIFFLEDYFFHQPSRGAEGMLFGRREALEFISQNEKDYKTILVSRSLSEPQIYVAFYNQWDPKSYQVETKDWLRYRDLGLPFLDQLSEYRLGKYLFKNINYLDDSKIPGVILVGKPSEFPEYANPIKIIYYPNQSPSIYIVDPLVVK